MSDIFFAKQLLMSASEPLPDGPYILASKKKILSPGINEYLTYNTTPQILENTLTNTTYIPTTFDISFAYNIRSLIQGTKNILSVGGILDFYINKAKPCAHFPWINQEIQDEMTQKIANDYVVYHGSNVFNEDGWGNVAFTGNGNQITWVTWPYGEERPDYSSKFIDENDKGLGTDLSIQGNLTSFTNDINVIQGFNDTSFLYTSMTPNTLKNASSWRIEAEFSIVKPAEGTEYPVYCAICGGASRYTFPAIMLYIYKRDTDNTIWVQPYFNVSSNGSSWNIANKDNASSNNTFLPSNSSDWYEGHSIALEFTGSEYILQWSFTPGGSWSTIATVQSSTKTYGSSSNLNLQFGNAFPNYNVLNGRLNRKGIKIFIDGVQYKPKMWYSRGRYPVFDSNFPLTVYRDRNIVKDIKVLSLGE